MTYNRNFSIYLSILSIMFLILCNVMQFKAAIISPLPDKNMAWDGIRAKLLEKENDFKLKKGFSIVPEAMASSPANDASSYVVVDFDSGKILAEKDMDKKVPVASLTKMMTAAVTLDLADPNEVFTVNQRAVDEIPTKLALLPGEKFTVEELLNAALLTSANDMVDVIQDGIDAKYGPGTFVKAMNEKAKDLGLKNSHFQNPKGFDSPENYSTAADLAIITNYDMKHYPLVASIMSKDSEVLQANANHRKFNLPNWQGLMDVYPGVIGGKIGNTGAAQTTTSVVSQRDGHTIVAVLLGAPDILKRDAWTADLLNIGFEQLAGLPPVDVTDQMLRAKYATWNV